MKRGRHESEDSSSESSEESGISFDVESKDVTDVEFDIYDPQSSDYHSVKQLLLPLGTVNVFELADLICSQQQVGSMIKCGQVEEQPLGFISVLNLVVYKDKKCISEIKDILYSNAPVEMKNTIMSCFENTSCGLLLNRRVINLPFELGPNLHMCLRDDIEWAVKNAPKTLRESFDFSCFLCICKVSSDNKKGKKKAKSKSKPQFVYFEEEYYFDNAILSFPLSLGNANFIIVLIERSVLQKCSKEMPLYLGMAL